MIARCGAQQGSSGFSRRQRFSHRSRARRVAVKYGVGRLDRRGSSTSSSGSSSSGGGGSGVACNANALAQQREQKRRASQSLWDRGNFAHEQRQKTNADGSNCA